MDEEILDKLTKNYFNLEDKYIQEKQFSNRYKLFTLQDSQYDIITIYSLLK